MRDNTTYTVYVNGRAMPIASTTSLNLALAGKQDHSHAAAQYLLTLPENVAAPFADHRGISAPQVTITATLFGRPGFVVGTTLDAIEAAGAVGAYNAGCQERRDMLRDFEVEA